MVLLELLIVSIVHLAIIGLDVLNFFVVICGLVLRWPKRPLLALDRVGEPVTDPLVASVAPAVPCNWISGDERRRCVAAAVALLVLALGRLALAGLLA